MVADCGELAIFGPKPDGRRVACRVHKEEDHVDLSKAICTVDGCARVARFGEIGARPLTCVHHRQPQFVDCSTKRCEHVEPSEYGNSAGTLCLAGANYGDPLERKRRFCRGAASCIPSSVPPCPRATCYPNLEKQATMLIKYLEDGELATES